MPKDKRIKMVKGEEMLELNIKTMDKIKTLRKLSPIIKRLIVSGIIKHFHYFFDEPWGDISLRFETDAPADLKAAFGKMGKWQDFDQFNEEKDWQPFWNEFKQLFQAVSLFSLALAVYEKRPEIITVPKLVHCILNELGYRRIDEISAYSRFVIGACYIKALEDTKFFAKQKTVKGRKQKWDAELPDRPRWERGGLLNI